MNLVSREKAIDVAIDEYNRGYKEGFEAGKASVSGDGDLISRKTVLNWLTNEWDGMVTSVFDGIKDLPSAQPDKDMIHLQKEQAYMQGWEDGREALREEIWEDGRDRLD